MKNKIIWLLVLIIFESCSNEVGQNNLTQDQLDSAKISECDLIKKQIQESKMDTIGQSNYIPRTLSECFTQLDSILNPLQKEWIKCLPDRKFATIAHHDFGMTIRNNWGLWGGSELAGNLYLMGIFHPDDMSSIILTSYQRRLKGENLKIKEQLKYYQDYWRKNGMSIDSLLHIFDSIRPLVKRK